MTTNIQFLFQRLVRFKINKTVPIISCLILSFVPAILVGHASADTPQAVVGMPFSGKWAWNASVMQPYPPYVDSCSNGASNCPGLSSHPSVHHTPGGGNWATDIYAAEGTAVKLDVPVVTGGTLSFSWKSVTSCGQSTAVNIIVGGTTIGWLYYAHLNNAVTSGTITNGMTLGTVHDWGANCNPGVHVHTEFKNTTNYSCYVDNGQPGVTLSYGTNLAVLGSSNTGAQQACSSIPAITPPPPPPPPPTYPLALSADYDESTGLTEVFSGDQKNNMLRETYWLYQQTPQTVSISANISGNITDIASFVVNGWRHLYTATSTGAIYETIWQSGQSATTWQVASIPNVIGIAATYDASSGLTSVFSVDASRNIDETYWLYGQTPQTTVITQLASGMPTSISAILYNGYRHVEVSTREGPVTETWWQYGQAASTWQVASVSNAVGVSVAMAGTVTEVFTLDTSNATHETYWDYGQQPQTAPFPSQQGTASGIASFVTASGYRHVYTSTADTPHVVTETWWYPTQAHAIWQIASF